MTIVLVRHGETAGNAGLVLQPAEIPLNERGIRQAEQLAPRLAQLGAVHILCSDLPRAQMTAAPVARLTGLSIEDAPLLQERNFGDLRGTPYSALPTNPFAPGFAPPNGETWEMFYERVAQAFALITARREALNGPLIVVTHGLVCRAIVERHVPPPADVVPERFDNTSVTVLGAESPYAVELVNCTAHLQETVAGARVGGAA